MAKPRSPRDAAAIVADQLVPPFFAERQRLAVIDDWYRWHHDDPFSPKRASTESKELSKRAETPWGQLIVASVAQACYLDGYRSEGTTANADPWDYVWQRNGMDRRQIPVHRAALAYGYSYALELPGRDPFTDSRYPVVRGVSPRRGMALYLDPANDEWPAFFLEATPRRIDTNSVGWTFTMFDEVAAYTFHADGDASELVYITTEAHDVGFTPVARFTNQLDLEGRADGEIEPFIPLFGRIDQTVFDRLVVQRFASWIVRTATGLSPPDDIADEDRPAYMDKVKLRLAVNDVLVAEDTDTQFGSLPATPLDGFIKALESDIHVLAAVSQTPAHEMLGDMANLSAEALAAARASLTAKTEERRIGFGESWEQVFRLGAWIMGDVEAATDFSAAVRWRDTEVRSLSQAADALGKLAAQLAVPVEMLWSMIPGWTDDDVKAAADMAKDPDAIDRLIDALERQGTGAPSTNGAAAV